MSNLPRLVPITVQRAGASVSQVGFGALLAVYQIDVATQPERYKSYASISEVSATSLPTKVKSAAAVFFQQNPNSGEFVVGRRVPGTAQVDTVTVTSADAGTWSFDLNGDTASYVAGALDTENDIADGLRTAAIALGHDLVFSAAVGGIFTITALTAGDAFTTAAFVAGGAGAGSVVNTIANVAAEDMSDCLDAIEAAGDTSYCLVIEDRDDTDILEAAGWTESRSRIYIAQSDDPDIINGVASNIAEQLQTLNYARTACFYHHDDAEFLDVAVAARCLSFRLDQESGTWALKTLVGVTPDPTPLTSGQIDNIESYDANAYVPFGGQNATWNGKMASGLYIDQKTTEDWTVARIREGIASVLLGASTKVPYTLQGAALIEGFMLGHGNTGVRANHYAAGTVVVSVPDPATLSAAQRATRQLPNLSFAYTEAGAIHSADVTIVIST